MKKLIKFIFFIILLLNYIYSFSATYDENHYTTTYDNEWYWTNEDVKKYQEYLNSEAERLWINDSTKVDWKVWWDTKALERAVLAANSTTDFTSPSFTIEVNDIAPADRVEWGTIREVSNNLLWKIIQSLMIPLWAIALLIMTIWAWYMIFYHWQDELLTKWKSIFNSWLIALIVALSAYYMVSLVRFILYST